MRHRFNAGTIAACVLFYCLWWVAVIVHCVHNQTQLKAELYYAIAGFVLPLIAFIALSEETATIRILSAIGAHCLVGTVILYRHP